MRLLTIIFTVLGIALLAAYPPGRFELTVPLQGPFPHHRGFAYLAELPRHWLPGTEFMLVEGDRDLGPHHSVPTEVATRGEGAYLQWENALCFSTSDNSDPNANGRRYAIRAPGAWLPAPVYLVVIFATSLGMSFLLNEGMRRRAPQTRRRPLRSLVAIALGNLLLSVAFIQLVFAVIVPYRVSKEKREIQQWYAHLFEGGDPGFQPGNSLYFAEHHYLNYALNPDVRYGDTKQFDRIFRIRRGEAIRPRESVKWRMLVLGGSTTFGEGLPLERDTWVYQLERLVRERYGEDCDVINGGVLGYTIAENTIHYVTLLTNLQPDVVLLYTGINDVHPRLFGRLAFDYSNYRVPWRSGLSVLPPVSSNWAWFYPYRYYFLTRLLRLKVGGIGELVSYPYPDPSQWEREFEQNGTEVYRSYLENLVRLVRAQGRGVAIVPQYFHALKESQATFVKGVEENNRVNFEVASGFAVPYAAAVADG
jgi:lysophospholipase L1-like esterase